MANSIPLKTRRKIVNTYRTGRYSLKEVMEKFSVSKSSVIKFMRLQKEGTSLRPNAPHGTGRSTVLSAEDFPRLRALVKDFPHLNQSQLHRLFCQQANKKIGRTTFLRYLQALNGSPQHTAHFQKKYPYTSKSGPKRERYPSDLSEQEWEMILEEVEPKKKRRPCVYSKREVLNAIFYQAKTGCQWRYLSKVFPPWNLVAKHFYRWKQLGVFERLHDKLRKQVRQASGRQETPSVCLLDSQSVKTTEAGGPKGYDGGKKVKGRKRHILVDTLGLLLEGKVHEANLHDASGLEQVMVSGLKKSTLA